MTNCLSEREIFELFDCYGNDRGDYYEIDVGRIYRLVKDIEFKLLTQKQGEPVVWANVEEGVISPTFSWKISLTKKEGMIPLYTTPQIKPLSDEEIWELHQEHIDEIPCGHSMKTIGFVEFARAIEERHGIK